VHHGWCCGVAVTHGVTILAEHEALLVVLCGLTGDEMGHLRESISNNVDYIIPSGGSSVCSLILYTVSKRVV